MSTVTLSQDQAKVLNSLMDWHKSEDKNRFISLGGYAGTGKTTLISFLRKLLHKEKENLKVAFCSYTGKATRVLQNKLAANEALFQGEGGEDCVDISGDIGDVYHIYLFAGDSA